MARRILLIDDDPVYVKLFVAMHKALDAGFELACANGGRAGLEALRVRGDDTLVLLDLQMPDLSGQDTLREIRSDPKMRNVPVLILTHSMRREDQQLPYELGATSFLIKPMTMAGFKALFDTAGSTWALLFGPEPKAPS